MITEIDLLTEEECWQVRSIVHKLKKFWIQRHAKLPFYTLGLASPYDVPINQQGYYKEVKRYNAILNGCLEWLYKRLAQIIYQHLGASAIYPENLALPGFHVLLSDKAFEQPLGTVHCDKSYMFHWRPAEGIDFHNPISFTLPITLPKFGGGMNIWDLKYAEVQGLEHKEIEQLALRRTKSFHLYKAGKLVLHSGHTVHQIAPAQNIQLDDERITLQGHGLLCQNIWQLHW